MIALGILALATLAFIPYGDNAAARGQQQVAVDGRQFAWVMNPSTITAGTPVRFGVTASDVNHGFGVYNDDNVLLFQIQAVPKRISHIVYTFKEPGRYQVVCLEFCGVNHHKMIGALPGGAPMSSNRLRVPTRRWTSAEGHRRESRESPRS